MALQSALAYVAGRLTRVFPLQASSGAASAGSLVALNASGAVDASMLTTRTPVADASYTALATDRLIAFTSLTAARTVTLPAAASFPPGMRLLVVDESGACSPTITITIAAAGSDLVNGVAAAMLAVAYGFLALESNASGSWTIIDQPSNAVASMTVGSGSPSVTPGSLAPLYVAKQGGVSAVIDNFSGSSSTLPTLGLVFRAARGTIASPSSIQQNDPVGAIACRGYGATAFSGNRGNIRFAATQTWTDSAQGTSIAFSVVANGGTSPTTAATIDNTGFLGLGTTTPACAIDCPTGPIRPIVGTVAQISALTAAQGAVQGAIAYATNARMFTGLGMQEASGSGSGGHVSFSGSAWRIMGTNTTMSA